MGAQDDIDLLTTCCNLILPFIQEREAEALRILEMSGSTVAVNSLRALRVQRTIVAVGMFSIYESVLQDSFGWKSAFIQLKRELKQRGYSEIAEDFDTFRLAVNVLKHGRGSSHDALLKKVPHLKFNVSGDGSNFDDEGDINQGQYLIRVDDHFVENCAELIRKTREISREWLLDNS